MNDTLVVEISGKRPGGVKQRPTEKFAISYDHLIISNNSDGYETDWDIVNVPQDYVEWYKANARIGENSWYAPMNRSYAIKYAKEHGYKYLVQLDDNIERLEVAWKSKNKRIRVVSATEMMDEFIDVLVEVLKRSNAGMAGMALGGVANPDTSFLRERFCYSMFGLKVDVVPPLFHGDFEDDIDYRMKLAQMGIPTVQVAPLRYMKTGQAENNDMTGCREEYIKAGTKRGQNMSKLYGDMYKCGMRSKANCINSKKTAGRAVFQHRLKPIRVGVVLDGGEQRVKEKVLAIAKKYGKPVNKYVIKVKKRDGKAKKTNR